MGGATGTSNLASIDTPGGATSTLQLIMAGANGITLTGGSGTNNSAKITQAGGSLAQTITVTGGGIVLEGGGAAGTSGNSAQIVQAGSGLQHVMADSIQLTAGGGAAGSGNSALIQTTSGSGASQLIDIGSGGLMLQGGHGSGAATGPGFGHFRTLRATKRRTFQFPAQATSRLLAATRRQTRLRQQAMMPVSPVSDWCIRLAEGNADRSRRHYAKRRFERRAKYWLYHEYRA